MTRQKLKTLHNFPNKRIRYVTCCEIFPTTSTTNIRESSGILEVTRSRCKTIEEDTIEKELSENFMDSETCRNYHCKCSQFKQQNTVEFILNSENFTTKLPENSRNKITPKNDDAQIWRIKKRGISEKRAVENERRMISGKWCKFRAIFLVILLLIMHWPNEVLTARSKNANSGQCDAYYVPLLLAQHVTSSTAAQFTRSCRCAPDWRSHFCAQVPQYKSVIAINQIHGQDEANQLPVVCICRQFTMENNCQQFMTQCFFAHANKPNDCMCCFNQPGPFCNQLQCHNGEPIFGVNANVTCICHSPTHYPYNICAQKSTIYDHEETAIGSNNDDGMSHYIRYPLRGVPIEQEESSAVLLFGFRITPTLAISIVLGLLGAVALLTVTLLVTRTCRSHREHRNRTAKREMAQSVLLEQRAEEEKYLP